VQAGGDTQAAASSAGAARPAYQGHAFISYVREDSAKVDTLQRALEDARIPAWRDKSRLWPGENWRVKIRDAITHDALVFIACFSASSVARQKTYQYEELLLAIDQLRIRRPDDPWLVPVRFDDCDVPDFELGGGRTLASIHRADLFGAGETPKLPGL
jgi:TIR domain